MWGSLRFPCHESHPSLHLYQSTFLRGPTLSTSLQDAAVLYSSREGPKSLCHSTESQVCRLELSDAGVSLILKPKLLIKFFYTG